MKNLGTFETVIKIIFAVLIILAAGLFITTKSKTANTSASPSAGSLTMWGTLPKSAFMATQSALATAHPDLKISYKEIPENSFDTTLVDALASGAGPDVILVPSDQVLRQRNRIRVIPFTTYSQEQFDNLFVAGASSFVLPWGIAGIPIGIDPMILYYNRDLLSSAFLVKPISTWDDIDTQHSLLTAIDPTTGALTQSIIPLGTTKNIPHFADILSLLVMQSGGSIVRFDGTKFVSALRDSVPGGVLQPATTALQYYLSFSDPTATRYTWSPGMRDAQQAFIAGEVAYYIGYASEYNTIRTMNPNLNFDITIMPQPKGSKNKMTFARSYGLVMMKNAKNPTLAFSAMNILADPAINSPLLKASILAPALRVSLGEKQTDERADIIYKSAIISRDFWNPDSTTVPETLSRLVNTIQSGIATPSQALSAADTALDIAYGRIIPPQATTTTP